MTNDKHMEDPRTARRCLSMVGESGAELNVIQGERILITGGAGTIG